MWKDIVSKPSRRFVPIADLRPTQLTVGMREVEIKRVRWRKRDCESAARFLSTNGIPVVLGPHEQHYVIDRHHLARALIDEGVRKWPVAIIANESNLTPDAFWAVLASRNWTHPLDDKGRRRDYGDIPRSIADLVDDPYRSLAGSLKRAGGHAKDRAPFSEFRWADFLRSRIDRVTVEADFDTALALAIKLATGSEAMLLPGWLGAPISIN